MEQDGIRKVGDEGVRIDTFDGMAITVETDPRGILKTGNTVLTGRVYAAYINIENKTGLICLNVDTGQPYWSEPSGIIERPFALYVQPHQVISISNIFELAERSLEN